MKTTTLVVSSIVAAGTIVTGVYLALPPKDIPTVKWRWDVDPYLVATKTPYCTEWWSSDRADAPLKDWKLKYEIYNTNFIAIPTTNAQEFFIRRMRFTNILGQAQYSDWSRNPKL